VTLPNPGPWALSVAIHLVVVGLAGLLLAGVAREPPPVLTMRLVVPGGPAAPAATRSSWVPPVERRARATSEPSLPAWRGSTPSPSLAPVTTVPVSLDELLGPAPASPPTDEPAPTVSGWTGPGGVGYSPPPLPPPGLAPPQGAHWSLVLSVPGGGGFALGFEGLDSGHASLDRWLEEYLRTVSFPSSPDGRDYLVRWTLRLESGRPQ
jgi:hypothetical protein